MPKPARPNSAEDRLTFLECLILLLSVYVLVALFVQTVFQLPPAVDQLIDRLDFAVCLVFVYEFFHRLYKAPVKMKFLKWGWIDLVASVPMFDFLRWGRLVRVIRILRILRAFRSSKRLIYYFLKRRAQSTLAAVALISIVLAISSSIAILNFETEPESNIKTPADALWWSFVTITTVGYGDKYPVTHEGRIIAGVLMMAGIGLFVTFTGYVTSFFLEAEQKKEESEIQELVREVRALSEKVEALEATINDERRLASPSEVARLP
jgi:voltage-gated potassium channel